MNRELSERCRRCGAFIPWPKLDGALVFGDGTAECSTCAEREVGRLLAAGERAVEPKLAEDEAEVMLRGEMG